VNETPQRPPIDPVLFRTVLGHFPTGACVVAAMAGDEPVGLSCNSFTSVSLAPPLILFCPGKASTTWPLIRRAGRFAVHVLAERDDALCRQFARRGIDRFAGVRWRPSALGTPVLDGALARLECAIAAEHDGGDHTIVVADVLDLDAAGDDRPLVVFRGSFGGFAAAAGAPGDEPR
jgi:flavin reductase (DIM6/NTAB) family NADH-FMN oxidoreductase RutF